MTDKENPMKNDHAALAAEHDQLRGHWGSKWREATRNVTAEALLAAAHTILAANEDAMFLHVETSDQGDYLAFTKVVCVDGTTIEDAEDLDEEVSDLLMDVDTESSTSQGIWQRPEFCEVINDHGGYYAFDLHKLIVYFEEEN